MFNWIKKTGKTKSSDKLRIEKHPMLDIALEQLAVQEDDVFLHIGFGWDLELLIQLVPRLAKGRLAGIESNQAALDRAISLFNDEFTSFKVDFRNAVVSKIPFYDSSFTKVLSLDQMHTWINIDKGMDEINRVLAPGGIFVLVWSQPLDSDTEIQGRRIISPEEVDAFLKGAGFYHPALRKHAEGNLQYYQFTSRKL
jgi:ubiquinone/menaquinone biosynthesis C-methylase UbiE